MNGQAHRARRWLATIAIATTAFVTVVVVPFGFPDTAAASNHGAVFHAVTPTRLADTRQATCGCTEVDANTIRVKVGGANGIPASAVSASLTITITGTTGAGFATAWPSGSAMPNASNVNWRAGETRANGAIIQLGSGGSLDVWVSSDAEVIVDVSGVFVPSSGAVSAGRFTSITPARLIDTRNVGPRPENTTLTIPRPAGVPGDATALALNITITDTAGWGFASAFPAGTSAPNASVVNSDGPGQTRAATAIVPIMSAGLEIALDGAMHLIVDVTGWFTGPSAAASTAGLFVSRVPTRVMDTRHPYTPIWTGGTRELQPEGDIDLGDAADVWFELQVQAAAVVYNVTVTETSWPGWLAAYPARTAQPETSSINWGADETVANLVITPRSSHGIAYFGFRETDIIVDVTGYFTGPAVPASGSKAPNQQPGYTGEPPIDLVRDAVPPEVLNVVQNVEYRTVPTLGGAAGVASSPPERVAFAEFIYGFRRNVARSVAAHEIGHILAFRWEVAGGSRQQIDAIGGDECLAEALGRLMFARLDRGNYVAGYGTTLIACSTSIAAGALAVEIVDFTT